MKFIRKNLGLIITIVIINIFAFFWIKYKFDFVEWLFEDGKTTSDEMSPMMFVLMFYVFDFMVSKIVPLVSIILIVREIISFIKQNRNNWGTTKYHNNEDY